MKIIITRLLLTVLIGCFIWALASCNCGGCEQTTITESAELIIDNSIKADRLVGLSIKAVNTIQRSDNKCTDKVLRVCTIDELSIELLSIKCNKDLKLKTETVTEGKNLLDLLTKDNSLNNPYWNGSFRVRLPLNDSFASGDYTFILAGTTKDGKPVNDTAVFTY